MAKIRNNPNLNFEPTKDNIIHVNIYYNTLTYTLKTESQLRDIVSVLAYVGGIISLFLGASVFSLFELIEVLLNIYYIRKNKKIELF